MTNNNNTNNNGENMTTSKYVGRRNVKRKRYCHVCGEREYPNQRKACQEALAWARAEIRKEERRMIAYSPRRVSRVNEHALFDSYDAYEWEG